MFSAVLSSGLSLEKTPLPLSTNLLSNQKLDEKHSETPFTRPISSNSVDYWTHE